MATYEITGPGGISYEINGPDNAPPPLAAAQSLIAQQHAETVARTSAQIAASKASIANDQTNNPWVAPVTNRGVVGNLLADTGPALEKFGEATYGLPAQIAGALQPLAPAQMRKRTQAIAANQNNPNDDEFAPVQPLPVQNLATQLVDPVIGKESMIGKGITAHTQGPGAFAKFLQGVPHGIAMETQTNLPGQIMNIMGLVGAGHMAAGVGVEGLTALSSDLRAAAASATDAGKAARFTAAADHADAAAHRLNAVAHPVEPLMRAAAGKLADTTEGQALTARGTALLSPEDGAIPAATEPYEPTPAATPPAGAQTAQQATPSHAQQAQAANATAEQTALLRAEAQRHAEATAPLIQRAATLTPGSDAAAMMNKTLKGAGMEHAANNRMITGNMTGTEANALKKYAASNYVGKPVTVDTPAGPVDGKVVKTVFGRVQVQHPDGTITSHAAEDVTPTAGAQAPEHPALTALRDTLGIPRGSVPEPPPAAQSVTPIDTATPSENAPEPVPAQATAPPTPEAAPKPPVNRAANLNLDRMETPADIKAAILQDVQTHAKEIAQTRGPVTHAETADLAKSLGMQPKDVAAMRPGQALNSHEMLALRQLLLDGKALVNTTQDAYKAAPTPENGAALSLAAKQYQTLLLTTTGATAEAGRTLNAFKILSKAYRSPNQMAEDLYRPPSKNEPPPPPTTSPAFGSSNKLFTADRATAARTALRQAASRLNSGIDPTLLPHLVELGGYYVEGGLRSLAAWSKAMLSDAPNLSADDLKSIWDKVRPEVVKRAAQSLSATERVRDELLKNLAGDDVDKMSKQLAALKPDDYAGFSNLMRQYSKSGTLDKLTTLWKAGLLSGPHTFGKIYTAHAAYLLAEEAAQIPAAIVDLAMSKVTGQRSVGGASLAAMKRASVAAATKGIAEAKVIMKGGDTALKLRGSVIPDSGSSPFYPEADFGSKALNWYAHGVFRLHGASYQIMKVYAYTRALEEMHQVNAANVAKKLPAMSEADMQAMAVETMEQRTFINKNALVSAYSGARRALPAVGRAFLDVTVPFPKVPTNVVAKLGEYAFGLPISGYQIVKGLREGGMSIEDQRRFATTFGRGTVGAAGIALGYQMYRHGLIKPPDHKSYEPGSIYAGGKWQQVGHVQPVGGMILLGATMGKLWDEKQRGETPDITSAVTATFGELPFMSGMGTVSDLLGPDANARDRVVNGLVGSIVPAFVSQVAASQDQFKRKVKTPIDAIRRAIPNTPLTRGFNRQQLQPYTNLSETRDLVNPFDPYAGKPLTLDEVAAMANQKTSRRRP